jgi:hypothetical protein
MHPSPKKSLGPNIATTASFPDPFTTDNFHCAFLDVHHIVRGIALRIDGFAFPIVDDLSRHSRGIKEGLGVESGEGSVGFGLLDFHFRARTSRFGGRPKSFHTNKLTRINLYKTGQQPAWNFLGSNQTVKEIESVAGTQTGPAGILISSFLCRGLRERATQNPLSNSGEFLP